jgi:O-antigen/teichoic acid export membrane protein
MLRLMTSRVLKKDYIWNTIGVFAQNAISPLLLIVVSRVNGIFDSGIFSFAFSIAIIFWAIGLWGGRTYQVSDVINEFNHRSYIMVRLLLALFMLVGAVVFAALNGYDFTKSALIISLVIFKAIESIADALYGIMQVYNRLYITGKSLLFKAILGIILFLMVDILSHNILLSCTGLIVANILILFFYDIPNARKHENITIHRREVKQYVRNAFQIMKTCAPIAIIIFLSMFSLNVPRYFLEIYH